MDDVTRNRIESFDRCEQWFNDHATGVNSNLKLKNNSLEFVAELNLVRAEVGEQAAATSESQEQTGVKAVTRADCVALAERCNSAALAAEIEHPGIQIRYPRPRNLNDEALVALLRSYAIGGATDEQILIDYAAPADWVAQCTAKADAFEAASQAQSSAKSEKVGKRASILARVDKLSQMVTTCGHLIDNVFDGDIAAIASWKSASHVEAPPKKKKPPVTPPPPEEPEE